MNSPADKAAWRAMLDSAVQSKLESEPDAITLYAAKPLPDRRPYKARPSVQDEAFSRELDQMRAESEKSDQVESPQAGLNKGLTLDDYPGLLNPGPRRR